MRNIITIVRKEMNSYFCSPIAYLLLFLFAVATGGVFYLYIKTFMFQALTQAQYAQMYEQQMPPMNVNVCSVSEPITPSFTRRRSVSMGNTTFGSLRASV